MTENGTRICLELRDLSFRFSSRTEYLWRKVSLRLKEGEAVLVEGINGSGKSTLLDVIQGRRRASSGEIWMFDREVSSWESWKRCSRWVARSFQEIRYPESMKAWEMVSLGLKGGRDESLGRILMPFFRKETREDLARRRKRAEQALEELGWGSLAMAPIRTLSGGQRKILEYGLVSLRDSRIFLLDEPLMGLSDKARKQVLELCSRLLERGACLVVVEHRNRSDSFEKYFDLNKRLELSIG